MIIAAVLIAQLDVVEVRWRHHRQQACRAVMMTTLNPIMPHTMTPFELHWKAVLDALGGKNETASKRPD